MRTNQQQQRREPIEHAVVLGGSMAGLLVARVLADHAQRVTVLERDQSLGSGEHRKGLPQGRHAHLLLQSGLRALSQLFPTFEQDLEQVAGPSYDVVQETAWRIDGLYRPRYASRYRAYAVGRGPLEALVASHVARLPNVSIERGAPVAGFEWSGRRVAAAVLASGRRVDGDLFIDASGRGSRASEWLKRAGFDEPLLQTVTLDLSYTSCLIELAPEAQPHARMVLIPPRPARGPYGALLVPVEGHRHVLTIVAYEKAQAPRSFDQLLRCLEQVDEPALKSLIMGCTRHSELHVFTIPEQRYRRFDRLRTLPANLLCVGDALCSFDPGLGQGMSVCALEAQLLQRLLARGAALEALPRAFYRAAARIIAGPWSMARAPSQSTHTSRLARLLGDYRRALLAAAALDTQLHEAFLKVVNLEAHPRSLLAPGVLWRVFLAQRKRRLSLRAPSQPALTERPSYVEESR